VFLYDERQEKLPFVVIAQEGMLRSVFRRNLSRDALSGEMVLTLHQGKTYSLDAPSQTTQIWGFREYKLYLKTDEGATGTASPSRMASVGMLLDVIRKPVSIAQKNEYSSELWRRISTSLSPLIFCLLGIGLGTVRTRAVHSRGVLITLLVILVYWEALIFAFLKGMYGIWPAALALQLPNLVILIPGVFFFRRASW
jgi:lipopolysaccharide export LptBFGC system permease protein LptF